MNVLNRVRISFLALACALVLAACVTSGIAQTAARRAQVESRVHELLNAYATNDQDAVPRLVDRHDLAIYGSDISEFVQTPAGLRQMMSDDFRLWHTAKFGAIRNLDIRVGGDLATAFFDTPFSAGGQPAVSVRFATTWRNANDVWLLTQSSNAVPTVDSSARDLLKR